MGECGYLSLMFCFAFSFMFTVAIWFCGLFRSLYTYSSPWVGTDEKGVGEGRLGGLSWR